MAKVAKRNVYAEVPVAGSSIKVKRLVAAKGHAVPPQYRGLVPDTELTDIVETEQSLVGGTVVSTAGGNENAALEQRAELEKLERTELDEKARAAGVEGPEKLPNKGAVIDALIAATASGS